jgi:hypothetical protein
VKAVKPTAKQKGGDMSRGREKYYKTVFLIAAVYDIVLGIIFTFFYRFAFELLGIEHALPFYGAYLSLIGSFLFVIGVAYLLIFLSDLKQNLNLIIVGTLYKLAYSSVAIFYLITGEYPHIIFISLFGAMDMIFFVMMLECVIHVRKLQRS